MAPNVDVIGLNFISAVEVTPDDGESLAPTRALWVGSEGDVAVKLIGDTDSVVFVAVPDGTLLRVCAEKVLSTGTTASNILALY